MSETPRITLVEDPRDAEIPDPKAILARFGITENPSKVFIGGAGQAGNNILRMATTLLDPETHSSLRLAAVNMDSKPFVQLVQSKGPERPKYLNDWLRSIDQGRFEFMQLGEKGAGAGGEAEISAAAFGAQKERFQKLVADANAAVIFAGEGGGTGTGVLPEMAKLVAEVPDIAGFVVPFIPFEFEGAVRFKRAIEGRKAAAEHLCTITIYNQVIYVRGWEKDEENHSMHHRIEMVNQRIVLPIIETLAQLTLKTARTINRDLSDLRRVAKGREAYISKVVRQNGEPCSRAVQRLLNDNAQDPGIVRRSNEGIAILVGDFSDKEVREVMEMIEVTMREEHPDIDISLAAGFDENPDAQEVYFICSSPEFKEPKTNWVISEEKKVHAVLEEKKAEEAEECEKMTLQDLMGTHVKKISVRQAGSVNGMDTYVSENFAKFWDWFWRENTKWTTEKRLQRFDVIRTYLLGHEDHIEPFPPLDLRFIPEEVKLSPEEEELKRKGLAGILPPKKKSTTGKGWFRRNT